jgi:hypothetical protein
MKDIKRNLSRYVKGIFYFSIMLGVPFFRTPIQWDEWDEDAGWIAPDLQAVGWKTS